MRVAVKRGASNAFYVDEQPHIGGLTNAHPINACTQVLCSTTYSTPMDPFVPGKVDELLSSLPSHRWTSLVRRS